MKYYRLDKIEKCELEGAKPSYYMIIGRRSNGKTYAALEKCIKDWFDYGYQFAYIRRFYDDISGRYGGTIFNNHISHGLIEKYSKGEWNNIYYYSGQYFFERVESDGKRIRDNKPFGYSFAINIAERYKSNAYPNIHNIVFDEFIATDGVGLGDGEFVVYMNLLSTIIRDPSRTDVNIYMLANTVNWDAIYFREMGLSNVRNMKQGTIDCYRYGQTDVIVAVEYCKDQGGDSKPVDRYFAFDNPELKMITEGVWEISAYPRTPFKYKNKDVLMTFILVYNEDILQGDVVSIENTTFLNIHPKTTPIQNEDKDIIYSNHLDPRPNWLVNFMKPYKNYQKKLTDMYVNSMTYYSDNTTGQIFNNYITWCKENDLRK